MGVLDGSLGRVAQAVEDFPERVFLLGGKSVQIVQNQGVGAVDFLLGNVDGWFVGFGEIVVLVNSEILLWRNDGCSWLFVRMSWLAFLSQCG